MSRLQESATFDPATTPFGQAVDAGPWRLTLTDAQIDEEAFATIAGTNAGNDPAPDGLIWILAFISAENTSEIPRVINMTDFAATGTDGILRRPPAMECPDPALGAVVDPGETTEGWVPLQVNDAGNVLVWFASPVLDGDSQAWFALTDGAAIPAFDPVAEESGLGTSPDAPAGFGETVRAGDFNVTASQHISGEAVYNIATTGLRALASSTGYDAWHAIRLQVTNTSPRPAFFSFTAVHVADATGEAWDHVLALTPPIPEAAKEIVPGATRDGWMAFEEQPWSTLSLLRIQPSYVTDEPRFITFGSTPSSSETKPDEKSIPTTDFAVGDQAVLTEEDLVNLRSDPSASGEIITEMKVDTLMTITGDAIDVDDYIWYPVELVESGEAGYVVDDFLQAAGN